MQHIQCMFAFLTGAVTRSVTRSRSVLLCLCACLALVPVLSFIFSSTTFAATRNNSIIRSTAIQQDIERAGVSAVRLVVTYTPAPNTSPSTTKKQANAASLTRFNALFITNANTVNSDITCTGVGVIVSSWLDSTTTATENNAWILTDGTLVNKNGSPSGTCSQTPITKSTLKLASIQMFFSSTYNSTGLLQNIPISTIFCAAGSTCDTGPVLIGFHSDIAFPYLNIFQSPTPVPAQPIAIALSSSSTQFTAATADNAKSFLTPFRLPIDNLAAPQFTGTTSAKTQYGMPVVNQNGEMLGLYATAQAGPAPQIQSVVPDMQLQTLLTANNADPTGRQNTVNTDWTNGFNDYMRGTSGSTLYQQAHTAFQDASQKSNGRFTGANHYASLTATSSGNGDTSKTSSNTTSKSGDIAIPYLGTYPLWQIIVVALIIILGLSLLLSLNALFARWRTQNANVEVNRESKPTSDHATQPEASLSSSGTPGQQMAMPTMSQVPPPPVQMSPSLAPYNAGSVVQSNMQISPPAPVANAYSNGDIVNQPTLVNAPLQPQSAYINGSDLDATVPLHLRQQAPVRELGFEVITDTNPGLKRQYKPNEDSVFAVQGVRDNHGTPQQIGLFIVADGMGGHADGKAASTLAIQTIIDYVLPELLRHREPVDNPAQLLSDGVQKANHAVHQHNMDNHGDMGTTVTTTMLIGNIAYVANVGDSRTYLYRPTQGLAKITRDHSVVASLVDAGIIKEEDIYTHTKRNQIYRSLGEKPFVEVDTFMKELLSGDTLLLCSDGMWEMARDPQIQQILQEQAVDPQEVGNRLIQAALQGGGEDNVSVIVINVLDTPNIEMTPGLKPIYQQEGVRMPMLS